MRLFRVALAASLTASALLYFLWTIHWPLVGDASLIHYIAFLIDRGYAPYRDFSDMNMPGSYLIELAAMHLFGYGDLAWRLFDFSLLAAASASFYVIARRAEISRANSSLAAMFSAALFVLIHGRDGLAEGGQRDLTMAVCLLLATAFLFHAVRKPAWPAPASWSAAAFGFFAGIAIAIKPTVLPLPLAQLLLAAITLQRYLAARDTRGPQHPSVPTRPTDQAAHPFHLHRESSTASRTVLLAYIAPALLAILVAPALALIFLTRQHALDAFLGTLHTLIPYYAGLGHRPLSFIVLHSISPLLPVVLLWVAALALDRTDSLRRLSPGFPRDWERTALLAGVVFGLIDCILQARAQPYYRYPLLAFLLPVIGLDLLRILEPTHPGTPPSPASPVRVASGQIAQLLSLAALAFAGLFLAPQSAILIHRYRYRETDFITSLQHTLEALGGPALSTHIQCIDTISGCNNVLYRMRLEPATGVLSDFFLFGPDQAPAVRQTRDQFTAALRANPPTVIVVTSPLFLTSLDNFQKLDRWPAFPTFLAANYTLATEWSPTRTARWWSREETPASYRIYVLSPAN